MPSSSNKSTYIVPTRPVHILNFRTSPLSTSIRSLHENLILSSMPVTRQKLRGKDIPSITAKPETIQTDRKSIEAAPPKKLPTDLPILPFETPSAFEQYLDEHHLTSPGIHVKLARKATGLPSITHEQLAEGALCFGWIDGQSNKCDENYFLTRCTPRRKKNVWIQKNVNTVARLLNEGRMRAAGIAAVDAAKADGRWDRAYAGPKDTTVQEDLQAVLDTNEVAQAFFKSLNSTEKFAVLWRIDTTSPTARAGRTNALVEGLAAGFVPGRMKEKSETSNWHERYTQSSDSESQ